MERDTSALNAKILQGYTNDGYIIAAVLPEVSVTAEGIYSFTVSIDKSVPAGVKLLWRSLPQDGQNIDNDDESAVFANSEGQEISTAPEDFSVKVSAWLRAGITYEPVILAKADDVIVRSAEDSGESESESNVSGGCNAVPSLTVMLLLSVLLTRKKFHRA